MARICTDLLHFQDVRPAAQELTKRLGRYNTVERALKQDDEIETLVAYAAQYWPLHFRAAQNDADEGYMEELTPFYVDAAGGLQQFWFSIYWRVTERYGTQPRVDALQLATLLGHVRQVRRMLQSARLHAIDDVDEKGNTALIWASRYGHVEAVQTLLDAGADVNAQGGRYRSALQAASANGHVEVAQLLVRHGATIVS